MNKPCYWSITVRRDGAGTLYGQAAREGATVMKMAQDALIGVDLSVHALGSLGWCPTVVYLSATVFNTVLALSL